MSMMHNIPSPAARDHTHAWWWRKTSLVQLQVARAVRLQGRYVSSQAWCWKSRAPFGDNESKHIEHIAWLRSLS
jgi:hypothetical protein